MRVIFKMFTGWGVRRGPGLRGIALLPLFAAGLALFANGTLRAQPAVRDIEVKATLLFNFCHFVQWPDAAFPDQAAPFVIAILGRDPFGKFLDELVAGEKTHGRRIVVQRVSRVEEMVQAHLVYVSPTEQTRMRRLIAALRGRPVLTVGEEIGEGFTQLGGLIGFSTEDRNIKIRINLDEARAVGLSISAKLLRLAKVTRTQNSP
jgi:hypothetical protein